MTGLRIAMVTEHYYPHPGGVSEHVYHLAAHLAERGHHVQLFTGDCRERGDVRVPPGVGLVHVGARNVVLGFNGAVSRLTVGLSAGEQVRRLLEHGRYHVVHVHAPLWPMLPLLAVKHAPAEAALVGTIHSVFEPSLGVRLARPYLQRCLDRLDAIVSVSPSVPEAHARVGLRYTGAIIPNGVDLPYWRGGRPLAALADGRVNLLTLARLDARNELDLVVRALPIVKRACPEVRLVMVGDGPERARLQALVPAALRDDVVFTGTRVADRNDLTASAHVFCFTHGMASQSVALTEGMAAGLPVAYQAYPFTADVITDGVEGLACPPGDVSGYAAQLVRLVRDPALRARLGDAARRRAEGYAWPRLGARVEAIYEEALAGRARAAC